MRIMLLATMHARRQMDVRKRESLRPTGPANSPISIPLTAFGPLKAEDRPPKGSEGIASVSAKKLVPRGDNSRD